MFISGAGVSNVGGALNIRSMQVGFPAKLTSTYDSSTGYSWERLAQVAGTGVIAASLPQTGAYAYAVDGNTGLAVNTLVWLEPDANGQGYTFISAFTPTLFTQEWTDTFLSSNTTWIDTNGGSITLDPGTYIISTIVGGYARTSAGQGSLWARFYNQTAGTILNQCNAPVVTANQINLDFYGSATLEAQVTFSVQTEVRLQGLRYPHLTGAPTWVIANLGYIVSTLTFMNPNLITAAKIG